VPISYNAFPIVGKVPTACFPPLLALTCFVFSPFKDEPRNFPSRFCICICSRFEQELEKVIRRESEGMSDVFSAEVLGIKWSKVIQKDVQVVESFLT
jgi:hypothetical protein